jgi:hypothetical protein
LEEVVRATTAWLSGFLAHVMAGNSVKRCPFLATSPDSIAYIIFPTKKGFNENLVVGDQE